MQSLFERMERFPAQLNALTASLSPQEARRRPAPAAWSILEIVGHIEEEERLDFRARLESTLRAPGEAWPPIDPEGWVREHAYQELELGPTLEAFARERARSVAWLRGLERPDWQLTHEHPSLGRLRAGDLLAAWAAHDTLHLRQLARRLYEGVVIDAGEFDAAYAGGWS